MMRDMLSDFRFAARTLERQRTFALVSTLTLALGVGAAATMSSVVNGVLLNPLPYSRPQEIVALRAHFENGGDGYLSVPEFFDLREQLVPRTFSRIAMVLPVSGNLTGVDVPERIESRAVSGDFFPVLNVRPELGRTFVPADERPGITELAVISHSLWQRRYGGAADVIGKKLLLDDDQYIIVGVMPPAFEHPGSTRAAPVDFWYPGGFRGTPFSPPTRSQRVEGDQVIARLAPGVTLHAAQQEIARLSRDLVAAYPNDYGNRGFSIQAAPLHEQLVGAARRGLLTLLAAVGLVLLVACTNVAALQLARGASRVGELSVRRALGAGRSRLIRQLLTESAVLGLAGGVAGVVLALLTVALLRARLPLTLPRASEVSVDARVIIVSLLLAVLLTMAFGLIPAIALTRGTLATALRGSSRGAVGSRAAARSTLVVVEVALAVMLIAGAGLLIRSFVRLNQVRPGFDASQLLTMQIAVPYPNDPRRGKYVDPAARATYYREVARRVSEMAGVEGAALMGSVPFADVPVGRPLFSVEGQAISNPADLPRIELRAASPGVFRVLKVPLIRGREVTNDDNAASAPVAIVTEALARRYWPNEEAVGRRFRLGAPSAATPWITVVGVVGDMRTRSLGEEIAPLIFLSYLQRPPLIIGLVIRARGDAQAMGERIARTVRSVERDQPVYAVRTMDELMATAVAQRRFAMQTLGVFAGLALALAAVGLYGLLSYTVAQRTREIGLRIALGATPGNAVWLVVKHGISLASMGVAVGTIAALAVSRWLAAMLYGVSAHDPLTFLAAPVVLLLAAMAASWIPGRRAASVDPLVALRSD